MTENFEEEIREKYERILAFDAMNGGEAIRMCDDLLKEIRDFEKNDKLGKSEFVSLARRLVLNRRGYGNLWLAKQRSHSGEDVGLVQLAISDFKLACEMDKKLLNKKPWFGDAPYEIGLRDSEEYLKSLESFQ